MQIYTDTNGIQRLLVTGSFIVDAITGETDVPVLWDTNVDGEIPSLAEVGGYSVVEGELVYSQLDFDTNEALKVTVAQAEATALIAELKQLAQDIKTAQTPEAIIFRSTILLMKDEINLLRAWITNFKAAVAGAATLAALKTAVAALDNMPARTNAQIETGFTNKITADVGNLD